MNPAKATGLGEPELIGKKSLFQPPGKSILPKENRDDAIKPTAETRMRMTLEVTKQSLAIMQEYQSRYRLEHGRALPKWRIISEALVLYDREKKGEGNAAK